MGGVTGEVNGDAVRKLGWHDVIGNREEGKMIRHASEPPPPSITTLSPSTFSPEPSTPSFYAQDAPLTGSGSTPTLSATVDLDLSREEEVKLTESLKESGASKNSHIHLLLN